MGSTYSYAIYSPALPIPFNDFTFSNLCAPATSTLTYQIFVDSLTTLLSSHPLNALLTLSTSPNKIVALSASNLLVGTYQIYLKGTLRDGNGNTRDALT